MLGSDEAFREEMLNDLKRTVNYMCYGGGGFVFREVEYPLYLTVFEWGMAPDFSPGLVANGTAVLRLVEMPLPASPFGEV